MVGRFVNKVRLGIRDRGVPSCSSSRRKKKSSRFTATLLRQRVLLVRRVKRFSRKRTQRTPGVQQFMAFIRRHVSWRHSKECFWLLDKCGLSARTLTEHRSQVKYVIYCANYWPQVFWDYWNRRITINYPQITIIICDMTNVNDNGHQQTLRI